jgi:hypothetical protein
MKYPSMRSDPGFLRLRDLTKRIPRQQKHDLALGSAKAVSRAH